MFVAPHGLISTGSFTPVLVTCKHGAAVQPKVQASIRWRSKSNNNYHVKGEARLEQALNNSVATYRIAYDGHRICPDGNKDGACHGELFLPPLAKWNLEADNLWSNNCMCRRIVITIPEDATTLGPLSVTLTMPIEDAEMAASSKLMKKALKQARDIVDQQVDDIKHKEVIADAERHSD